MVTVLAIIAALIILFLFFSYPRKRLTNPTADIETPMGRTTIFHYRSKDPRGKGVIAMVHGFCENQLYFQRVAEPLTEAGYDCIAINLFGYNGSIPNDPAHYTVEAYARQIREALQELERLRNIKKLAAVWGHSMGATALLLASNDVVVAHPEVQGLFLENPGFGGTVSVLSRLLKPTALLANFTGPRHLLQVFVNFLFTRKVDDPQAKLFLKRMLTDYAPNKETATKNVDSVFGTDFSLDGLSENAIKRLYFIFSQKDKLMNLRKVERHVISKLRAHSVFDEGQLWVVPRVDHFISLQAPDEIADFVLKQLKAKEEALLSTPAS